MAVTVIDKINSEFKDKFLTPALRRLLSNSFIQPHFDYVSSAWYPNLTQKMKNNNNINAFGIVCS